MTEKPTFDATAILKAVADIHSSVQQTLTPEERALVQQRREAAERPPMYSAEEHADAESDFEMLATADALEALAGEVSALVELRMKTAYEQALKVYYAAEELARDPANAELIPHVEAIRKAHREQYGRDIPPKDET